MGKFRVCSEYVGDEGHVIEAYDHESAAENYAEWEDWFSADYTIVGGESIKVTVECLRTGDVKRFNVIGESVPVYRATEERCHIYGCHEGREALAQHAAAIESVKRGGGG